MVVLRTTSAFACSRSHYLCFLLLVLVTIIKMHPMSALASVKTALVTGSTDGIGLTTAKALASMGFRVIVHGRDSERVKKACTIVREAGGSFSSAIPALSDISTFEGCKTLADIVSTSCLVQNSPLDLIVNNAGIFLQHSSRRETVQWSHEHILERTFAVNVAAPFVITSLLLPLLTAQDGSRIVIVSSISQSSTVRDWQDLQFEKRPFSNHQAYSESKLLDAMLCMEMAERLNVLGTERVTVNCLDPGTVNTKMLLAGWGPCGIHVEDALDETWLSTSLDVRGKTGLYFVGRRDRKAAWPAYDLDQRKNLWNILGTLAPDASQAWNFSVNQRDKLEENKKIVGPS